MWNEQQSTNKNQNLFVSYTTLSGQKNNLLMSRQKKQSQKVLAISDLLSIYSASTMSSLT